MRKQFQLLAVAAGLFLTVPTLLIAQPKPAQAPTSNQPAHEAEYYRILTLPIPDDFRARIEGDPDSPDAVRRRLDHLERSPLSAVVLAVTTAAKETPPCFDLC